MARPGRGLGDPFTAQYARESGPADVWDSPVFTHVNVMVTTVWGAVFATMAVESLVGYP
ncbi:hypothetical protein [Streptomyces sp. NPDC046197]|uniref:hypothetical protein n=1 Tax=Streptomyces sp. NPDC046197 TaxID=3154337 RepID=UPI0033C081D6